jgi:WhiB family redox-sensing transcriptional regulator
MIREVTGRDWRSDAACVVSGVDPEVFFPVDERPGSAGVARAKAVCGRCPVRPECLAEAMAVEDPAERWGVFGGLAPAQRAQLWTRRHPDPAATPVASAVAPVVPVVVVPVVGVPVGAQLVLWERVEGSAA